MSEDLSISRKSLPANKVLFLGVLASLSIRIAALYVPVTQDVLRVESLSACTWLAAAGLALPAIAVNEAHKRLRPATR